MPVNYWTEEEVSELRRCVGIGMTNAQVAQSLKRSCQAIAKKRHELRIPSPNRDRPRGAYERRVPEFDLSGLFPVDADWGTIIQDMRTRFEGCRTLKQYNAARLVHGLPECVPTMSYGQWKREQGL